MKQNNFEKTLPENYRLEKHINAANKKTGAAFTLLSVVPIIIVMAIAVPLAIYVVPAVLTDYMQITISLLGTVAVMLVYIVLHELVHGITYKALTGEKLTFGLSWSCAYCGVPNIYVYRKPALLALVMPLAVFSVIFGGLTIGFAFFDKALFCEAAFMLGLHLGGCVGDLYGTYLFATRFKDERTLMNDTGPEQFFYVPDGDLRDEL